MKHNSFRTSLIWNSQDVAPYAQVPLYSEIEKMSTECKVVAQFAQIELSSIPPFELPLLYVCSLHLRMGSEQFDLVVVIEKEDTTMR